MKVRKISSETVLRAQSKIIFQTTCINKLERVQDNTVNHPFTQNRFLKMNNNLLKLGIAAVATNLIVFGGGCAFKNDLFKLTIENEAKATNPTEIANNSLDSPQLLAAQSEEEKTRIEIYKKASPAVVAIDLGEGGHGSGFIVTSDGLVLTNRHVLENAPSVVSIILADGTKVEADVIGFAGENLDLAAAKIRGQNDLPTLKLAAPDSVEVGQDVFAIGTPRDLELRNSYTSGIVSGIHDNGGLIQHDADINGGNSGGPLLNSEAEVIGVNTMSLVGRVRTQDGQVVGISDGSIGINFALSVNVAQPFLVAVQEGNVSAVAQQPESPSSPEAGGQPPSGGGEEGTTIPALPIDGQAVAASLQAGDPTLPNNSYYHIYAFEGRAGQQVTIEADSQQIDPSLILFLPDTKEVVAQNDDIAPNNFNSRLQATLPRDGIYVVFTSAFEAGEAGEYNLRAMVQ
jgi:serine protease Do